MGIFILDSIKIVVLVFIICSLLISVYKITKRKRGNNTLNKLSIITDTNIINRLLGVVGFLILLFAGIILIYFGLTKTDIIFNMIIANVIGILICVFSIIYIINVLSETIKVLLGQYVIVVDELTKAKYQSNEIHIDGAYRDNSYWKLYFKDFSNKYNTYVRYDYRGDPKFDKGDKFFLVFIKGDGAVAHPYQQKTYTLSKREKEKLKSMDEAQKYIDKK